MLSVIRPATHTLRYNALSLEDIGEFECVIFSDERMDDRGSMTIWEEIKHSSRHEYIQITRFGAEDICVNTKFEEEIVISILDQDKLKSILSGKEILLDISGLPYNIWAPIFKAAFDSKIKLRVLYAEPESYRLHKNPSSYTTFDLSSEFSGPAPLPGFAKLEDPSMQRKSVFVALLGFEGNRPRSLIYPLDPAPRVIPVIGVPGFQVEFPTYTITCNQEVLDEFQAHSDIRYSRASCPFELYETLGMIHRDNPDAYMYIAPVGTKPHGLGAIWYAIAHPEFTEILFDHPIKKKGRTSGIGTIHIYDFSEALGGS